MVEVLSKKFCWLGYILVFGCTASNIPTSYDSSESPLNSSDSFSSQETAVVVTDDCDSLQGTVLQSGLSPHFQQWLETSNYTRDFARLDILGGAFGGLLNDQDCLRQRPIIFVHGNGDRALGGPLGGWQYPTEHLLANGYRQAELYATTWGNASVNLASQATHQRENVLQIRHFIEAVLAYSGKAEVDIISHSMGVTIARQAVLGGMASDRTGSYEIGDPLTEQVKVFIAIAGANWGLADCYMYPFSPTCNAIDGFYPGQYGLDQVVGMSAFLENLNAQTGYEGWHRYSIWSTADEVIKYGCMVWGENTCQLPGHTAERKFADHNHLDVRDKTLSAQLEFLQQ